MELVALGTPTVTVAGEAHTFTWCAGVVTIVLDRVREGRSDVTAEVTVSTTLPPAPGCLEWGRLTLTGVTPRGTMAKSLSERCPGFDWGGALLQASHAAVAHIRTGQPWVDLSQVPPRPGTRWLLWPYIEVGGPTLLMAKGGSCKSILALAMGLALKTGKPIIGTPKVPPMEVLYLDWETDASTHAERLSALCAANLFGADVPTIGYRRMVSSLAETVADVKREIDERKVGFVIADSLGYAGGGDANEQDIARQFWMAARFLDVPMLGVTHIRKANFDKEDDSSAFGSGYWMYGARLAWQVEPIKEEGSHIVRVRLAQRKENNTIRNMQHGYKLDFRNTGETDDQLVGVRISRLDLAGVPEFAGKLSWKARFEAGLANSALVPTALADAMGIDTEDTSEMQKFRVNLAKAKKTYLQMLPDGRVGLAARR